MRVAADGRALLDIVNSNAARESRRVGVRECTQETGPAARGSSAPAHRIDVPPNRAGVVRRGARHGRHGDKVVLFLVSPPVHFRVSLDTGGGAHGITPTRA